MNNLFTQDSQLYLEYLLEINSCLFISMCCLLLMLGTVVINLCINKTNKIPEHFFLYALALSFFLPVGIAFYEPIQGPQSYLNSPALKIKMLEEKKEKLELILEKRQKEEGERNAKLELTKKIYQLKREVAYLETKVNSTKQGL